MRILFDDREPTYMIDCLKILAQEKGFEVEGKHLEVGDFITQNVVIERKEAQDFLASICDRRLSEQAVKMALNFENRYIIIEGNLWSNITGMHPNSIIGTETSLVALKGCRILLTPNEMGTAYAIWSICNHHYENKQWNPELSRVKLKKPNIDDIKTAMLTLIPGIGYSKAKEILNTVNNDLLKVFSMNKLQLIGIKGVSSKIADEILKITGGVQNG